MEKTNQDNKNSVTEIKNSTGCFVDRETGKYFFTMPVLAMTPTGLSRSKKEEYALFFPAGNTCQATNANAQHLKNSSLDMYQALLGFDSQQVRDNLVNSLPRNDFFYNRSTYDCLKSRAEDNEFWNTYRRPPNKDMPSDRNWISNCINSLKLRATRVGINQQVEMLAPNSLVNTVIDLSINGFKDNDVWNTSTDDFENKFNQGTIVAIEKGSEEWLSRVSNLYYQHWYINAYGKLNTCFGDTSVESLRYVLLKETDHYALCNDGNVCDFGFMEDHQVNNLKEWFLLISCNKVKVNGVEMDLNKVERDELDVEQPVGRKINELINSLQVFLQNHSNLQNYPNRNINYYQLYLNKNIKYDLNTRRFAFIQKTDNLLIDNGDASGLVYTMLMDIIRNLCPRNHQLQYDFFLEKDQISDVVTVFQNGLVGVQPNIGSYRNKFSFSQHLQRDRRCDSDFYTHLYKSVTGGKDNNNNNNNNNNSDIESHKDGEKIFKFISNTFKFFDEYSVPPSLKEKFVFNDEEMKKCDESAKNTNYLAYFFKAEYLTEINNVIQKFNVQYTDDEKRRDKNIWLRNYYTELTNFLNQHDISDVLTEQGKAFFSKEKNSICYNEDEKNTTINRFDVTGDISCRFNKSINAIDFSVFNALLDAKNVKSGSRKDTLRSKIRLYVNYFFRNDKKDSFRTFRDNLGKLTKDAFSKICCEHFCKKVIADLKAQMEILKRMSDLNSSDKNLCAQTKEKFNHLMDSITKRDFREYLSKYLADNLKEVTIFGITINDIEVQDLIELLGSGNAEIGSLIEQCQKIQNDVYALKPKIQEKFNAKKYDELVNIYNDFYTGSVREFTKRVNDIKKYFGPKMASKSKRIFLNSDINVFSGTSDSDENAIQEFDEEFINKLVESACGKIAIKEENAIKEIKEKCKGKILACDSFCIKDDFWKIFSAAYIGTLAYADKTGEIEPFNKMLNTLLLNFKEIDNKLENNQEKRKALYKDMVYLRDNGEFKDVYSVWQFIQWMTYLTQIAVYITCKNDSAKLLKFKNNKHNLECHLRNGNFDRIMLNKDLSATSNLIGYLLSDCITDQDKIKSIIASVEYNLYDITNLSSDSAYSTQYNLLLMKKSGRKIGDGIFATNTKISTTDVLYFPVQSVERITNLYNHVSFINSLSNQARVNMGDINQESTLWFDEDRYRIVDIDEFFWECTMRGETLKSLIAYGQWNQIKFGSTLSKERKEQASSRNGDSPKKPLTLQERQNSFDEFASLLRYNPLSFVSSSLQTDKSQSTIFRLINDLCQNYYDNHRLGDFFDLIENVFLKKYKCMDINTTIVILEKAGNLDKYAEGNVNANSDDPVEKRGCPIIFSRENDSSIKSFGLQNGYEFELSIDFIINVVKHTWIPDISQCQSCLNPLFAKINNFSLVFCEEKKNADKNKRKELILLLYILYTVSTNVEKQKQEFNIVGDYENGDMKIEFYQSDSFNQFLRNKKFRNLLNLTQQFQTEVKEEEEQKQKDIEIQKKLERLQKEKEDQQQAEEKEQNIKEQNIDEQVKEKDKVNKEDEQNDNNKNGNEQNENIGERINLDKDVDNKNQNDDDTNNSAQIKEVPKVNEHNGENKENLTVEEQIIKYWMLEAGCWDNGAGNEDIKQILKECISKIRIGLPSETPQGKKEILLSVLMDMHESKQKIDIGMLIELWGLNEQEEGGYEENNNHNNNGNNQEEHNENEEENTIREPDKRPDKLPDKPKEKEFDQANNQDNNDDKFEKNNNNSNNQNKESNVGCVDGEQNINLNENENENKEKEKKYKENDNQNNNSNNQEKNSENEVEKIIKETDEPKVFDQDNDQDNNGESNNSNNKDKEDDINDESSVNPDRRGNSDDPNPNIEKANEEKKKEKDSEGRKEISKTQNNNQSIFGNPKNRQIAEGVALTLFIVLSILSRFIFPAWLLYISIVGMLISGGLLGGDIWITGKRDEEKDVNEIVSPVETKEINDKLKENQETNNRNQNNKAKPNVQTDIDNINQNQVNLNDERADK